MSLQLTFLGTGGAFTDFRVNYHNNALVRTDEGPVLIDCGGTAPQALRELGIHPESLRGILITHLHGDHVGGLEQVLWERFYVGSSGPTWRSCPVFAAPDVLDGVVQFLTPQVEWYTRSDLSVGPEGVSAVIDGQPWRPGAGRATDGAQVVTIGGVSFSLHATPHVSAPGGGKPSYGVRMRGPGGAVAYFTSDTEFRPDVGERFPEADTIFHDTTFGAYYQGTVHTHWSELRQLPAEVRRRTVLMHHTRVPAGVDVHAEGFAAAARRYETFEVVHGQGARSMGVLSPRPPSEPPPG